MLEPPARNPASHAFTALWGYPYVAVEKLVRSEFSLKCADDDRYFPCIFFQRVHHLIL